MINWWKCTRAKSCSLWLLRIACDTPGDPVMKAGAFRHSVMILHTCISCVICPVFSDRSSRWQTDRALYHFIPSRQLPRCHTLYLKSPEYSIGTWIMHGSCNFCILLRSLAAESSTWSPIKLLPQEEASELRSAKYGEARWTQRPAGNAGGWRVKYSLKLWLAGLVGW